MFEITGIDFLVPALVRSKSNDSSFSDKVDVDLKNKKVYGPEGSWGKTETDLFFAFLHKENTPPENAYAAKFGSDEEVDNIQQRMDGLQEQ